MTEKTMVGTIDAEPKKFNPIRDLLSFCCHSLTSPSTVLEEFRPRRPMMTVKMANAQPTAMVAGSAMVTVSERWGVI